MYRRSMSLIVFISAACLISSCTKSTEPVEEKPFYFSSTGMLYTYWHDISTPYGILPAYSEERRMDFKASTYYYNIMPASLKLDSILFQIPEGYSNHPVADFNVVYEPNARGIYNLTPDISDPVRNWGGLQRLLTIEEQSQSLFKKIQMWMKIVEAPKDAILNIDLGQMSEDIIPNMILDTEDKNYNGMLESGEDTGIDRISDFLEPGYNSLTNPDPAGDNFSFDGVNIGPGLNGTEKNSISIDAGRLPDTEDLSGDLILDRANDFYWYEIPLDTLNIGSQYIAERGKNGWMKIQIPVQDYKNAIGHPDINYFPAIRLWFNGAKGKIHLKFAELRIVPE